MPDSLLLYIKGIKMINKKAFLQGVNSLIILLFICDSAYAALLFNNGNLAYDSGKCDQGPNGCGISDGGRFTVFDNFELSNDSIISGFDYNDYFHNGTGYIETEWSIWTNLPTSSDGHIIYSGTNEATLSNGLGGSSLFTISDLSLELSNGIYWLSISNTVVPGTLTTYATTDRTGLVGGACQYDGRYCFSTYYERVFSIYGTPVPLPAAFWLFASGLLCLTAFKRKIV